jgi:hypothetical protein
MEETVEETTKTWNSKKYHLSTYFYFDRKNKRNNSIAYSRKLKKNNNSRKIVAGCLLCFDSISLENIHSDSIISFVGGIYLKPLLKVPVLVIDT